MRRNLLIFGVGAILLLSVCAAAQADAGDVASPEPMSESQAQSEALATMAYWTPERMAEAQPMPTPGVVVDVNDPALAEAPLVEASPGYSLGWMPGDGPQPDPRIGYTLSAEEAAALSAPAPQHGTMPTNPKDGPYGPFQRWTWFGAYVKPPVSTVGRLYFSLNGGSFVCSATAAARNMIITAGHCVSDGSGVFATNLLFCPSYNAGGVNPTTGCWTAGGQWVATAWHNSGDPDYDYACAVTAATGTIVSDRMGNVTGWLGRAWNWGSSRPVMDFGYPAGAPFPGYHIIVAAAAEWYTFHFVAGEQISKFIGNDMTGGSSGGGWILGLGHRSAEWPDTDSSNNTDPLPNGRGWLNGVNSHKRCVNGCGSPPTTTAGVFWQEMSSPPFHSSGAFAGAQSEDVFQACLDNGGS